MVKAGQRIRIRYKREIPEAIQKEYGGFNGIPRGKIYEVKTVTEGANGSTEVYFKLKNGVEAMVFVGEFDVVVGLRRLYE